MWFYLVAALVVWKVTSWLWMRWKYDLHKIPSPPGVPFLGQSLYFTKKPNSHTPMYKHINKWRQDLGNPKVMRMHLGGKTYLVVLDTAFIRDVVLSNRDGLPKSSGLGEDFKRILRNESDKLPFMATAEVTPYVKAMRRALSSCMNSTAIEASAPLLRKTLMRMMAVVERDRKKGPIDVEALFTRAALDNIGIFAFDFDFGALDHTKPYYECIIASGIHLRALFLRPLLKIQMKLLPWMQHCRKIQSDFNDLRSLWRKIAVEIRERSDMTNNEKRIWQVLKNLRDPETEDLLPVGLLMGEVATIVFTGMDTLGHTLGWTFALLATYPRVTDKIVDELKRHGLCGPEGREVLFSDLSSLEYITAVLKESIRVAYVLMFISRKSTVKDMDVLEYRVPKGTHFIVPTQMMMIHNGDWNAPEDFIPERWLSGEDMSQKYYFPFSTGARDCIGQRFGMNLMRWIMATFIAKYSFEWSDKGSSFESEYANIVNGAVMESSHGIRLQIEQRTF